MRMLSAVMLARVSSRERRPSMAALISLCWSVLMSISPLLSSRVSGIRWLRRCCFLCGQGGSLCCQGLPRLFFLLELGTQIGQCLFLCISPLLPPQGGDLHRLQMRCQLVHALFGRDELCRDLLLESIIPLTNPLLKECFHLLAKLVHDATQFPAEILAHLLHRLCLAGLRCFALLAYHAHIFSTASGIITHLVDLMILNIRRAIFARIPWKLCICCVASFYGIMGTSKCPGIT